MRTLFIQHFYLSKHHNWHIWMIQLWRTYFFKNFCKKTWGGHHSKYPFSYQISKAKKGSKRSYCSKNIFLIKIYDLGYNFHFLKFWYLYRIVIYRLIYVRCPGDRGERCSPVLRYTFLTKVFFLLQKQS